MADPSGTLTPEKIRTALERLAEVLSEQGVTARIDVFGGASLALAYSRNRTATADVDGSYSPIAAVEAAAEQVSYEMDLAAGWLNNRMRGALPPTEIETESIIERPGVMVRVGSARTILAMKLRASRVGRDFEDIAVLLRACAVSSVTEAEAIVDEFYLGEEQIPERGYALLEQAFGEVVVANADPPYTLPPVARSDA